MMSWVRLSHSCSICLDLVGLVPVRRIRTRASRSSSVGARHDPVARVMKSAKNFSSRGIRRNATHPCRDGMSSNDQIQRFVHRYTHVAPPVFMELTVPSHREQPITACDVGPSSRLTASPHLGALSALSLSLACHWRRSRPGRRSPSKPNRASSAESLDQSGARCPASPSPSPQGDRRGAHGRHRRRGRLRRHQSRPGQLQRDGRADPASRPRRATSCSASARSRQSTSTLGVAGVTESGRRSPPRRRCSTSSSAKIGVNVSPEEVENLPVNGRNFANLMTLATGATSDGNGGWASVRFNGKSNQQNYLNYDGVDGTYVWDASPGYLNATGSQFRLQTSMESVAEFRVNSGLAPAESGLGAGGNITVVSKSGSNRFAARSSNTSATTRSTAASKYDDNEAGADARSVRRLDRRPARREQDVLLRQLRRPAADDRAELHRSGAERRSAPPHPGGRAGRQRRRPERRAHAGGGAAAGRLPAGHARPRRIRCWRWRRRQRRPSRTRTRSRSASTTASATPSRSTRAISSATARSTRRIAPSRRAASARSSSRRTSWSTTSRSSAATWSTSSRSATTGPQTSAVAFGNQAGYDPVGVSLSGTVTSSSIDARGTTGIARSGLLIRATSSASTTTGSIFDPSSLSFSNALTWTRARTRSRSAANTATSQSEFQFLGSTEITYNSINDFIDNRPAAVAVALDSPVFKPQQYYLIGFVQDSWRATDRLTLELGLRYDFYSVVKEANGHAKPFFVEDNAFGTDPDNFYDPDKNNFSPRLSAAYRDRRQDGAARRLRPVLRPGPVRGSHPADRELHRAPARAAADVPNNGLPYPVDRRRSSPTCCRFAATRTTTRTNTTCSTASACRASCPARST